MRGVPGYGDTLGRYLVDKGASSSIRNRSGMVGARTDMPYCSYYSQDQTIGAV